MLEIRNTMAYIGINVNNSRLNIQTELPKMEIKNELPAININRELPKISIDQTQCFRESGLKPIMDLNYDAASAAKQAVSDYIAKAIREGEMLASNNKNAIADIAAENSTPEIIERKMELMPVSRPRFDVSGRISFDCSTPKSQYNLIRGSVQCYAQNSSVEYYLRQKNSIEINYTG